MKQATLEQATHSRIGKLVRERYANTPSIWEGYAALVKDLPKLLHQHGLRHTLDYLQFLTRHRQQAGALELLQDWGATPQQRDPAAPSLARLLITPPEADPHRLTQWRLQIERQATREAAAFKRYVEMLETQPLKTKTNIETNATESSSPPKSTHPLLTLPPAWAQTATPSVTCTHLGLSLRFAGQVPAHAPVGSEQVKTYRMEKVNALVQVGNTLAEQLAGDLEHPSVVVYRHALRRRVQDMKRIGHRCFTGELAQRLYTAHGERGVWETYVDLHPVYGFPILRASAVKACLKRHLQARVSQLVEDQQPQAQEWVALLLGTSDAASGTTNQGVLQLHDAWWLLGAKHPGPLVADIDNPHHPAYYQGRQAEAKDTDSPEPQPQWAVRGCFHFSIGLAPSLARAEPIPCPPALAGQLGGRLSTAQMAALDHSVSQSPSWIWLILLAEQWLQRALVEEGIGGAQRIAAGRFHSTFGA